jgi:hypothetical protein
MPTIIPAPATNPTTVTVKIGDHSRTFQLMVTTAPKSYDHGQTLEVYDGGDVRYLLVPEQAVEWTIGRNSSGLYPTAANDEMDAAACESRLWEAMYLGFNGEGK